MAAMRKSVAFLITTAILAVAPIAVRADVTGRASVIDGDTIEIQGQRIRLHGIDAPESNQTCRRDSEVWRCGQQASLALADKIGQGVAHALFGSDRSKFVVLSDFRFGLKGESRAALEIGRH
jgi:endonuclease YncB( thermonuclease family)